MMAYTAIATGGLGVRVTKPLARRTSSGHTCLWSTFYPQNITIAEIAWNGIPVNVINDTGSSDSWLVQDGFTCVDQENRNQPNTNCSFGPPFQGAFDGGAITNQHFNLMYADLELMTGIMGYETVTVAGITVEKQEVALVNYTYWFGDSVTSGLMGLAYSRLTSAFASTNSSVNDNDKQVPYDPIMTTMIKRDLIEPMFSLVLDRDSDNGSLALGGLPPVNHTGTIATTPILMIQIYDDEKMKTEYSFYTVIADAYIYMGSQKTRANTGIWEQLLQNITVNTTHFPVIVDSGTTLMYLPTEIYQDVMALFNPPAVFFEAVASAVTSCNASVPDFGNSIGGQVFMISQADMLLQASIDPATGLCEVGVMDKVAVHYTTSTGLFSVM
ncbi:hypothetical protein LA080_001340 [Diaporthe eres]|nr:hypothetical protein LA080_001340 [Diaporthe eres]